MCACVSPPPSLPLPLPLPLCATESSPLKPGVKGRAPRGMEKPVGRGTSYAPSALASFLGPVARKTDRQWTSVAAQCTSTRVVALFSGVYSSFARQQGVMTMHPSTHTHTPSSSAPPYTSNVLGYSKSFWFVPSSSESCQRETGENNQT